MKNFRRYFLLIFTFQFFSVFLFGKEASKSILGDFQDGLLMTIEDDSVMLSDFAYIYTKNNEDNIVEDKSFDEYFDLFTIFKLKVHEARMRGIDTTEAFKREYQSYRSQATFKYMRDDKTLDSLINVGYDRMSRDRYASHIAIACPKTATDSFRNQVLYKISDIRRLAVQDPDKFLDLAKQYSEDPGLEQNGGRIGWVRPYRFVYSFEEAVYNTPVGQISEIVKSPFGYHIIKVEEERRHEEVRVRHIMKIFNSGDEMSINNSHKKIDSLYTLLERGDDFATIAKKESDDKGSSYKGGDLGWFGRGMMVEAFENIAFNSKINSLSKPFKSEYGWHIINKLGQRDLLPIDSLRKQILNSIERDERMKIADSIFIVKMRREYKLPDTMSNTEVKQYVDDHLEERYEDFRYTVKEYHDGIMLFEVSLSEVWNKASTDTIGLQQFFERNRSAYNWTKPKFKGFLVQCRDKRIAKLANNIIKNNLSKHSDSIVSYVSKLLNVDSTAYVSIRQGLWGQGENSLVDKFAFGIKNVQYRVSEEYPIVFTSGKKIMAPEEVNDVRTELVSNYQDELDKLWISQLKKKYKVVVNEDLLKRYKEYIQKD